VLHLIHHICAGGGGHERFVERTKGLDGGHAGDGVDCGVVVHGDGPVPNVSGTAER
jgi:hypothetical protein